MAFYGDHQFKLDDLEITNRRLAHKRRHDSTSFHHDLGRLRTIKRHLLAPLSETLLCVFPH